MRYLFSLKQKDLSNKTCLLRVDLNITDNDLKKQKNHLRIEAILPTIKFLISRGTKVVILSHRGRPQTKVKSFSLKPLARILSKLLKKPIQFIDFRKDFKTIKKIIKTAPQGKIFLLENLRFIAGEDKNDVALAKKLASLGDFYVNDAFAVSHRKNASVVAITKFLPSYAGLLLEQEIKNLSRAMKNPKKPLVIILGGAKISDKIGVIKNFYKKADKFLIGGGVANTFFASRKMSVNHSLYEKNMIPLAKKLLKAQGKKIILPSDSAIKKGKILDIGPKTMREYANIIKKARTIVWNGPMGYFENPQFAKGSKAVGQAILQSHAFAIIGGGETTTLMSKVKGQNSKVFLSTGGGAMLEYLAGKKLPGITALK